MKLIDQSQLTNDALFKNVTKILNKAGLTRTQTSIVSRFKRLRSKYNEIKADLNHSGAGSLARDEFE